MIAAVICQLVLLIYHQITTFVDLYPFNGARNYSARERLAEMGVNAALMSLAPIGFTLNLHGLMLFGVIYYFVLFGVEIVIWWIPYFTVPSGCWRRAYNLVLSVATSNFEKGDALEHWLAVHQRLHDGTLTVVPKRGGRIVPNLEHTLLHGWTLVTAITTLIAYNGSRI
ncbi:MAG TPA: hypothetical protein VK395_15910 [Gemmataceae bacterium]|nr:hypothetical protein [Gemmataceae bacterium]